jgi:hypothetical protein
MVRRRARLGVSTALSDRGRGLSPICVFRGGRWGDPADRPGRAAGLNPDGARREHSSDLRRCARRRRRACASAHQNDGRGVHCTRPRARRCPDRVLRADGLKTPSGRSPGCIPPILRGGASVSATGGTHALMGERQRRSVSSGSSYATRLACESRGLQMQSRACKASAQVEPGKRHG